MKLHYVPRWVCSKPGHVGYTVYTQEIALNKFAEGFDIRLLPQNECMRVCVKDRTGDEHGDECYMCDREASNV
jgi:hypothetical protein